MRNPKRIVPSLPVVAALGRGMLGVFIAGYCLSCMPADAQDSGWKLASFSVDVTPSVGSPLAYDPMKEATTELSCRGMVLQASDQPAIVMCAIDWLGVANAAQDAFKTRIAEAIGTTPERVVVHALHQHDAPRCDLSAAKLLGDDAREHFDVPYITDCIERVAAACQRAQAELRPVRAIGFATANVQQVASNRRMLGPDGKVHTTRYTACKDPAVRALPEGVVDPQLSLLAFRGDSGVLAAMTFYATHPQSYYRTGQANSDFPGIARDARQTETGVFHIHFNGAGGNIGAGKYNDGTHANRQVLAEKVSSAMQEAWDSLQFEDAAGMELAWKTVPVTLPLGSHLHEATLVHALEDASVTGAERLNTAKKLALLRRNQAGHAIGISRLRIGQHYVLWMPGELFVEYQLAAKAMKPGAHVMMAAYGEYGTGYIGTRIAYPQGGYEVSERASNVSPAAETPLVEAMRELLQASDRRVVASDFTDTTGPALNR